MKATENSRFMKIKNDENRSFHHGVAKIIFRTPLALGLAFSKSVSLRYIYIFELLPNDQSKAARRKTHNITSYHAAHTAI
jgi:hypothetical protein